MKEVIFTDLDGTLLSENYSFKSAVPALEVLENRKIPLVFCTSKTRTEIEVYREKTGNRHPFISENGGAIFIPVNYFSKKNKRLIKWNYEVIELGKPYKDLVRALNELKKDFPIQGFSDMSVSEIAKHSGLSVFEAKMAKKRDYDEVFILREERLEKKLLRSIKKKGLNCTRGGRYYHLMGESDKGKAVRILSDLYKEKFGDVRTISFGDSRNDKPMLRVTDKGYLVNGPREFNRRVLRLLGADKKFARRAEKLYSKSLKILKKLQQGNGAILASPPKSRYPYVYPRDHAICILALIDAGEIKRARKALEFILKTQNRNGSFPQRLTTEGKDASYKPIQLDNAGLVLYAFMEYLKITSDRDFLKENRRKIRKSLAYLKSKMTKQHLFFTPNSIHEFPPLEEGLEIWANAVCYAALRKMEDFGIRTGFDLKKIRASIEEHFWFRKNFIKTIRLDESSSVVKDIDASSYAPAYFDVFEDGGEKVRKTVHEIEKELEHRKLGGICRYKEHVGRNNGGWGPWTHFTLMICRHFIKIGNKKKADKYINWVLRVAQNNKLPEHISTRGDFEEWAQSYEQAGILRHDRKIMVRNTRKNKMYKKGLAYSVLPLAWAHAEFIRTWILYKERFL